MDLLLGDPPWVPHPVKIMGRMIEILEKRLNVGSKPWKLKAKGLLLSLSVIGATIFAVTSTVSLFSTLGEVPKKISEILISYFALSTRDLYDHGMRVFRRLEAGDLDGAKMALSMIVGRDVAHMGEEEIIRSTVESISENTNDGSIAPIFYLLLGGPILSMVYKAVSTLDSMLGYKNERFIHFGFFPAKIDDVFAFIPARISAVLISVSSALYFGSLERFGASFRTFLRQGRKHPSPNSGYPISAMAGALGIRLSGPQYYGGVLYIKEYLGEDIRRPERIMIKNSLRIMLISSILLVLGGVFIRGI